MGQELNRRIVVSGHGGPEVLDVIEEAMPEPGAGEVRIKVLAAGVSAFDLIYRRWSRLPGRPPVPERYTGCPHCPTRHTIHNPRQQ